MSNQSIAFGRKPNPLPRYQVRERVGDFVWTETQLNVSPTAQIVAARSSERVYLGIAMNGASAVRVSTKASVTAANGGFALTATSQLFELRNQWQPGLIAADWYAVSNPGSAVMVLEIFYRPPG